VGGISVIMPALMYLHSQFNSTHLSKCKSFVSGEKEVSRASSKPQSHQNALVYHTVAILFIII
jgi:hypothetical protein